MSNIEVSRIKEIVSLHSEVVGLLESSLRKAIRIGELLSGQKAKLEHGDFGTWIKANLPFTDRTARSYMNCWRNRKLLKTESISDLSSAYRLMSPSKRPDIADFKVRLDTVETPEECLKIRDEILEATQDAAERLLYAEAELDEALKNITQINKKFPKPEIPEEWDYDTSVRTVKKLLAERDLLEIEMGISARSKI